MSKTADQQWDDFSDRMWGKLMEPTYEDVPIPLDAGGEMDVARLWVMFGVAIRGLRLVARKRDGERLSANGCFLRMVSAAYALKTLEGIQQDGPVPE